MCKMKKIGVCMAAVAGVAGIAGISAKAVEGVRKKWFLRGFEAGQFIGNLTAAENFAHEKTVIHGGEIFLEGLIILNKNSLLVKHLIFQD